MKSYQSGFTLIELMIVIAIIAILMSYAIPAYRDYTIRTKLSEGTAMAAAYKMAIGEAFSDSGLLAGINNDTQGIPGTTSIGNCVNSITVVDGEITIGYDCAAGSEGSADPRVDSAQLVWTPNLTTTNTLQWSCSATVQSPDQDPCK